MAVERFGLGRRPATVVVLAFALSAPLTSYGTQVYPELPAALAVTVAIAALTGPLERWGRWMLLAAVVALPWLSVKYAPVAVALVVVGAWTLWRRGDRRAVVSGAAVLVGAGLVYLLVHQVVYGGWTVYAAGDHFQEGGELSVTGQAPDYLSRTQRLVGLLVDRGFGLAAWAPVYLAAIPASRGPRPAPATALARPGPAPRRGLGQRHLDRPDHARLVVARPPDRRRPPLRRPGHVLVGAGVGTAPAAAGGGGDRGAGGARGRALGVAGGRGAAGAADPHRRLRGDAATRSTGRGAWSCRTCGTRRRSARCC